MIRKKMKISEFLREFTPESRPNRSTVIRRIERGDYDGIKEGGQWYILKSLSTGDARADDIMNRMGI